MDAAARIATLLGDVEHAVLDHPAAFSAEEAAAARGTPLEIGGKSLVLKIGKSGFAMFVVSGARRTSNKHIRHGLGIQRLRFARREELASLTGLSPGCIPPFGRPVFELPLYVDAHTLELPRIAFSLGSHERSVVMKTADWARVARPDRVFDFSVE